MSARTALIPTGSQTVGPFFSIGLNHLIEAAWERHDQSGRPLPPVEARPQATNGSDPAKSGEPLIDRAPTRAAGIITIQGQVFDGDGAGVPDAMLEFWSPAAEQTDPAGYAVGFRRVATDGDGKFCVTLLRPTPAAWPDGRLQAPHLLVLVFARGLLRHLLSRVYCADEEAISSDPLLQEVPAERRGTLVAQAQGPSAYGWNIILQGQNETVFFAW